MQSGVITKKSKTSSKILNKQEIQKLYDEQRMPVRQIASEYGLSYSPMLRFMRINGIRRRDSGESHRKITDEDFSVIVKRYQDGDTINKLAEEFVVGKSTIHNYFNAASISYHPRRKSLDKKEVDRLYHEQKLPTTKIAPILGVSKPTLLSFMRENNIEVRTAGESKTKIILTDEVTKNFKKLYEDNKLSHQKIAEKYGVSEMTINHMLRKLGIRSRERPDKYIPRTKEMSDEICRWYHEYNLTQRDIAEVLGVGEIAVHDFMKDMGISVRNRSKRLSVRRKVDLKVLIEQYESSGAIKKWRRNRKGAYNKVICDQCGVDYYRTPSSLNEKFHFCCNGHQRDYSLVHGFIPGRRPNLSEEKLLQILKSVSNEWRFVGDNSLIISGRNPDFWDGGTNLIELFGEPWHPITDEERKIAHYKKNGYSCMVIWWEQLKNDKKVPVLENQIRQWLVKKG